jgi:hypothetical protein
MTDTHPCPACGDACQPERRGCPLSADYFAAFDAWAQDTTNRALWMRVNAALDGLRAHQPDQPGHEADR